ncbi:MAG: ribosome hibernation-promoting factor, HPF/YfiA family [Pseudobdellovibrionaceae bacterium]
MKLQHTFRHLDHSDSLVGFVSDRLQDVERFLLKDGQGHVTYKKQKGQFVVEVSINTTQKYFKATALHSNIYSAVDEVVQKLEKQFLKLRKRVQNHKKFELSDEGQMQHLNDQLEYNISYRKAA